MLKKEDSLIIGLAFDENFLLPLLVNLTSIFQNNQHKKVQIHAVTVIDKTQQKILKRFVNELNGEIFFYKVNNAYVKSFAVSNYARYSMAVYYRLFLPHLIPDTIKKIIYLDTDTLVINSNLDELYDLEIENYPIAVAIDKNTIRPDLGIFENEQYFNSGVMLINTKIWKSLEVTEKAIKFIRDNPEKIIYHDQDALNAVLKNNWYKIDNKFNLTFRDTADLLDENHHDVLKNIVIIHYNHPFKPWEINCTDRFRYLFIDYASKFLESNCGKLFLIKNVTAALFYLSINQLDYKEYTIEDTILLAFKLHLIWIRAINERYSDETYINIIQNTYINDNTIQATNNATSDIESIYDSNLDVLYKILEEITNLSNSNQSDHESVGLEGWLEVCRYKIKQIISQSNKINYKKFLIIPNHINKTFFISGLSEYFINYSIHKFHTKLIVNEIN